MLKDSRHRLAHRLAVVTMCIAVATVLANSSAHTVQAALPAFVGSFAPMLEKVIPAVVTLRVTGEKYTPSELKPRKARTNPKAAPAPEKEVFRTGGSGVIVDAVHGFILTNNHVIENATKIEVGLSDGRRMLAKVIGRDVGTDLAVIKIEAKSLPSLILGDSDSVRVGDIVAAVGNPYGLEGTATIGIIGAVMRTEIGHEAFEDYFQIDAQIHPGNSGGALVDVNGELIGINSVIGGSKGQIGGIGFAIPINMAKVIQTELIAHGRMRRGSPGLIVEDLPLDMIEAETGGITRGAKVAQVLANSSAARAGVKPGDIVIGAGSKPVRSAAEYMTRTSTVPLGSRLALALYSDGQAKTIALTMSEVVLPPVKRSLQRSAGTIAGAVVGDIGPGNPLYGDLRGAQVYEVPTASPAYQAGVEPGDVVISVDNLKVRTSDDLLQRIERAGLQYRVDVIRNGVPVWLRVNR